MGKSSGRTGSVIRSSWGTAGRPGTVGMAVGATRSPRGRFRCGGSGESGEGNRRSAKDDGQRSEEDDGPRSAEDDGPRSVGEDGRGPEEVVGVADFAGTGGSPSYPRGGCGSCEGPRGRADRVGVGSTGPVAGGGRNGTSIAPGRSWPVISREPAVITARVGREASPTSSATISTYRRVGPEKPRSSRYTPFRRLRSTLGGGAKSSSGRCDTCKSPWRKDQLGSVPVMGNERRMTRSAAAYRGHSCHSAITNAP